MAYDEGLAERIRDVLRGRRGVSERKMFGGGPARYVDALALLHLRAMDILGRPMNGYIYVAPPGSEDDAALERWITACSAFVAKLPLRKLDAAR